MAKLMSASVRPVFTAPSENTVKLTLGGLASVTAGCPAPCSTVNGAKGLIALSLAGTTAAAEIAAATSVFGGGVDPPLLSLPQPDTVTSTRVSIAHQVVELFIGYSIASRDSNSQRAWEQAAP